MPARLEREIHGKSARKVRPAVCVSGGIAAYKMPNVASALRKAGAEVHVVMTQNATQFITPRPLSP